MWLETIWIKFSLSLVTSVTSLVCPQAPPRFYPAAVEENREKTWDQNYVTDQKWWTWSVHKLWPHPFNNNKVNKRLKEGIDGDCPSPLETWDSTCNEAVVTSHQNWCPFLSSSVWTIARSRGIFRSEEDGVSLNRPSSGTLISREIFESAHLKFTLSGRFKQTSKQSSIHTRAQCSVGLTPAHQNKF